MTNLHGGDIYRNQVLYDFSININPLGMPKAAKEAAVKALEWIDHYPDPRGEELIEQLSQKEGVKPEQILLGNGAAELLYGLCMALRPKETLLLTPSFSEYEEAAKAAGSHLRFYELSKESNFRLEETFLECLTEEVDLLFLCNPNNPTGELLDLGLLGKILKRCEEKRITVCLDECFLPFLKEEETHTMKGRLAEFPHLLVLRAFTKVYGMPGLRLGYAMSANAELLGKIRSVLPPWNTSVVAQEAGKTALSIPENFLEQTRGYLEKEKVFLLEQLKAIGEVNVCGVGPNYIFFQAKDDLYERLLRRGILIRDCSNFRGLKKGYYRIAVRSHEENEALIRIWQE